MAVNKLLITVVLSICVYGSLAILPDSGRKAVSCMKDLSYCEITENSSTGDRFFDAGYIDFVNGLYTTGWDNLTVVLNTTAEGLSLRQKYYALGYAEGWIMQMRILDNFNNIWDRVFAKVIGDPKKRKVIEHYTKNKEWLEEFIESDPSDVYTQKVGQLMYYIKGMAKGYRANCFGCTEEEINLGNETMLFLLNMNGELGDIYSAYYSKNQSRGNRLIEGPDSLDDNPLGECSALIKLTGNDIFFGHATWNGFNFMMRSYKTYQFEGDSYVAFSARPGMIHCKDDWYMTGKGLSVMATTIGVHNTALFVEHLKEKYNMVPTFLRAQVANLLARDANEWTKIFDKYTSATFNGQWTISDVKRFKPGQPLPDSFFWVYESVPGTSVAKDLTALLQNDTYFGSVNTPYFDEINEISGNAEMERTYGSFFSYWNNPRSNIFHRDHSKVTDMASMKRMIRYNDYKNDEFSLIPNCSGTTTGKCTPPYSAMLAISPRGDLQPPGGEKEYGPQARYVRQVNHGGIDAKVNSYRSMFDNGGIGFTAEIINGPTYDDQPVFIKSESVFSNITWIGLPDVWNFTFVTYTTKPSNNTIPPPAPSEESTKFSLILSIVIVAIVALIIIIVIFIHRHSKKNEENEYALLN